MERFAIIALGGPIPNRAIGTCLRQGYDFIVIRIIDIASELDVEGVPVYDIPLTDADRVYNILREESLNTVVFAGILPFPDLSRIEDTEMFLRLTGRWGNLDRTLGVLRDQFSESHILIRPLSAVVPHITVEPGFQSAQKPNMADQVDKLKALRLLRLLSSFGCTQSVVVKNEVVLAIDAQEGTDALLDRVAYLTASHAKSGGVFVKLPPTCFRDVHVVPAIAPAIGLATIERVAKARLHGMIVSAELTMVFDAPDLFKYADQNELFVEAVAEAI